MSALVRKLIAACVDDVLRGDCEKIVGPRLPDPKPSAPSISGGRVVGPRIG